MTIIFTITTLEKNIAYPEINGPQCKDNMTYLLTPVVLTTSGVE